MSNQKDIILYSYGPSPHAKRVVWYLGLRKIPYFQCPQPMVLPRPDVTALGIAYRRIPILAIGRDVYNDTRLILSKLEQLYPASPEHPSISSFTPDQKAIDQLLDRWIMDGGVSRRIVQLFPPTAPVLNNSAFLKDREQLLGFRFRKEDLAKGRPEALAEVSEAFAFLETLLIDGRNWVVGTEGPSLADIRAIWTFYWAAKDLKGSLPPEQISPAQFPKAFAWIERFSAVVEELERPKDINGSEAVALITSSGYAEEVSHVESLATAGFHPGQEVEVWPVDSGFNNKDRGLLVALTTSEIVVEKWTEEGETVRMHTPRHAFGIIPVGSEAQL